MNTGRRLNEQELKCKRRGRSPPFSVGTCLKTRWENSIDGNNTPHRTLVCYKEGTQGENACGTKCDPLANTWTGLWRSGCPPAFTGVDGCLPENGLTGQISWGNGNASLVVPSTYKDFRFWRNTTSFQGAGQSATLSSNTIGHEYDCEQAHYVPSNWPEEYR
jgi:hypothetical protein